MCFEIVYERKFLKIGNYYVLSQMVSVGLMGGGNLYSSFSRENSKLMHTINITQILAENKYNKKEWMFF